MHAVTNPNTLTYLNRFLFPEDFSFGNKKKVSISRGFFFLIIIIFFFFVVGFHHRPMFFFFRRCLEKECNEGQ